MKILISLLMIIFIFSSCQQAPHKPKHSYWKPFTQQAMDDSIALHRPVIIDFWASWCPNCQSLDFYVFSRRDIREKLAKVTTLRMDVSNQDDPAIQKILQQYSIDGVPTIIFIDAHGKEIPNSRITGYEPPEAFSKDLSSVDIFN